jgi:hypothetical protein
VNRECWLMGPRHFRACKVDDVACVRDVDVRCRRKELLALQMVNLSTLFTLRMGKERPSLGEGRSEGGIVPYLEGSKRPCEERNRETASFFYEGKLLCFAEYDAKNTNSKIVQ